MDHCLLTSSLLPVTALPTRYQEAYPPLVIPIIVNKNMFLIDIAWLNTHPLNQRLSLGDPCPRVQQTCGATLYVRPAVSVSRLMCVCFAGVSVVTRAGLGTKFGPGNHRTDRRWGGGGGGGGDRDC